MLIFVQVVAVVSVIHLRRRANARQNSTTNGGWSALNNGGASSDEDDADGYGDSAVPEMEGMGGLPSYDDSEKVYAPPSYVVATPVLIQTTTFTTATAAAASPPGSHPPPASQGPLPALPHAVEMGATGPSESRA